MAKMSKIAKDIKNQPKLKKEIASFLAKNSKIKNEQDVLLHGHRGFLAMTEKELTKEFDALVERTVKDLEFCKKEMAERPSHWMASAISKNEILLKEAETVSSSIFDAIFL
jgi:hypothetical protein